MLGEKDALSAMQHAVLWATHFNESPKGEQCLKVGMATACE
jgi:hypothetical protein